MPLSGHTVGGVECGDGAGSPVLYCHGVPGSHVEAMAFDDVAGDVGVHVIAVDRPGIGLSSLAPRRQILEWADTAAAVADRFGLDRFAVLGVSGGGPHALACAYRLAERVTCAVVVSSPTQVDQGSRERVRGRKGGDGAAMLRRFPFLAQPIAARMNAVTRKPAGLEAMIAQMSLTDRARLADDDELLAKIAANVREAFTQGRRGVAADLQVLFSKPWGFELSDIAARVVVWHGSEDENVLVDHGRRTANRVPASEIVEIRGAGHLLFVDHTAAVLKSIHHRTCDDSWKL